MPNPVFANGMNVACKSGAAKVICAFPDVCLSPPSPPAGPIPIPYPVTSMSSDTTDGTGTVKINNKEAMLKDKSCYKKCMGDEAATKTLGMGVINHSLGGKTYFVMWSMDVMIEGENAVRALDITTSNHMSSTNVPVPMVNAEGVAIPLPEVCKGVDSKFILQPYKSKGKPGESEYTCGRQTGSDGKPLTGHHVIPGRCMRTEGGKYPEGCSHDKAPVICVEGKNQHGDTEHGECHAEFDSWEYLAKKDADGMLSYPDARDQAAKSCSGAKDGKQLTKKQQDCVKAQLDSYYENCIDTDTGKVKGKSSKSGLNLSKLDDLDDIS